MTAARRRVLRWGLRVCLLVALVALWVVDALMKGGDRAGFVPANPDWVAYAPSLDHVWNGVSFTSAFHGFIKQWPAPYRDACVSVRSATGIRPTSFRWRTWLGKKVIVVGSEKGIGWCVRPGVLVHVAHWINASISTPAAPDIFRYGPYCYSWREGFLVFSTSQELVKETLVGTEFHSGEQVNGDELYVGWRQSPQGFMVVSARDGLPVRGAVKTPPRGNGKETSPWPEDPFIAISSSDDFSLTGASRLLRWCFSMFPEWSRVSDIVPEQDSLVAVAAQVSAIEECGLALFEPRTHDLKTPEAALRFRFQGNAPAEPSVTIGDPPLKELTSGSLWYLSSSADLLQALTSHGEAGVGSPEAFVARLDWERAGKVLEAHFRSLLQQDDTLREQIEGSGIPATQALAALGQLHIEGRRENDRLALSGELAKVTTRQDSLPK